MQFSTCHKQKIKLRSSAEQVDSGLLSKKRERYSGLLSKIKERLRTSLDIDTRENF